LESPVRSAPHLFRGLEEDAAQPGQARVVPSLVPDHVERDVRDGEGRFEERLDRRESSRTSASDAPNRPSRSLRLKAAAAEPLPTEPRDAMAGSDEGCVGHDLDESGPVMGKSTLERRWQLVGVFDFDSKHAALGRERREARVV